MYKYNAAKHCIEDQGWPHPDTIESIQHLRNTDYYGIRIKEYNEHAASLKSYPVQGSVGWGDGQEVVEGKDFEIQQWCNNEGENTYVTNNPKYFHVKCHWCTFVAYPLQQAEEDELWNEVVAKIAAANIMGVSPSRPDAINTWKKDISKYLKQHFTITRKQ